MKVSLFTPTHDNKYLKDTYDSIKDQDFYEWVIIRNGKALSQSFEFIGGDTRVKLLDFSKDGNIGLLKSTACNQCSGDILVELDHDDLLTCDCIRDVRQAFLENGDVDFVYSNDARFRGGFVPDRKFNSIYGWEHRDFVYNGHTLNEAISFPATPASISKIWYAPDHVRAWKTSFYKKIGGHNVDLEILDDAEILIRTYLHGKIYHINKCLYLYRVYDNNTCYNADKNKQIQTGTIELYKKHIAELCERWCQLNNLEKLSLGGKLNGYLSISEKELGSSWDIPDESVGLIVANDIAQRCQDKMFFMEECHRVLAPSGYLLIKVPSALGEGAFQDPMHKSYWVKNSFLYYTNRSQASFIGNTKFRFQESLIENYYPSKYHKDLNIMYVRADLIKVGDARFPGILNW